MSIKELLIKNGYHSEQVNNWSDEECEAEWDEFCSSRVQVNE
jgi:hypothetical protein